LWPARCFRSSPFCASQPYAVEQTRAQARSRPSACMCVAVHACVHTRLCVPGPCKTSSMCLPSTSMQPPCMSAPHSSLQEHHTPTHRWALTQRNPHIWRHTALWTHAARGLVDTCSTRPCGLMQHAALWTHAARGLVDTCSTRAHAAPLTACPAPITQSHHTRRQHLARAQHHHTRTQHRARMLHHTLPQRPTLAWHRPCTHTQHRARTHTQHHSRVRAPPTCSSSSSLKSYTLAMPPSSAKLLAFSVNCFIFSFSARVSSSPRARMASMSAAAKGQAGQGVGGACTRQGGLKVVLRLGIARHKRVCRHPAGHWNAEQGRDKTAEQGRDKAAEQSKAEQGLFRARAPASVRFVGSELNTISAPYRTMFIRSSLLTCARG